MAAEHENPNSSNLPAESSAFVTDDELMIDNTSPIPLAIPPSILAVPPNALILTVPSRPSVPFPIRPPGVQSGEMRTSDSDSDQNQLRPTGTILVSTGGYEVSEAIQRTQVS